MNEQLKVWSGLFYVVNITSKKKYFLLKPRMPDIHLSSDNKKKDSIFSPSFFITFIASTCSQPMNAFCIFAMHPKNCILCLRLLITIIILLADDD